MSMETGRYPSARSDASVALNRFWWGLVNWDPDVFELFSSIVWIIWGIWTMVVPSVSDHSRYAVLYAYTGTAKMGLFLTLIGAARTVAIFKQSFPVRRFLCFVAAMAWGMIALTLIASDLSISSISHAFFALLTGWTYLRLRE
jgi:hypothetical protein